MRLRGFKFDQVNDKGFSLVAALMLVTILALAAIAYSRAVRTHTQITSNLAVAAEAEALADAGVNLAILDLKNLTEKRGTGRQIKTNGSPRTCSTEAGTITVGIEDESGKIDLNTASPALLAALLMSVGVDAASAKKKAAAIADYRDSDDKALEDGAEREDYAAQGRPGGPKNAPFASVNEVDQVLGIDATLSAALKPFISVYSGLPGLAVQVAEPAFVKRLADAARTEAVGFGSLARNDGLPAEFISLPANRAFKIRSVGTVPGGGTFLREAIVVFETDRRGSYAMKDWRRGEDASLLGPAPSNAPPC